MKTRIYAAPAVKGLKGFTESGRPQRVLIAPGFHRVRFNVINSLVLLRPRGSGPSLHFFGFICEAFPWIRRAHLSIFSSAWSCLSDHQNVCPLMRCGWENSVVPWANAGITLGLRRKQWPNVKPILSLVFAGRAPCTTLKVIYH